MSDEAQLIDERYRLDRQIGKGAVGSVWEAFDLLLQRRVAIKVVDLTTGSDPTISERFRREGIAIAGLDDQHVVKVYDTGSNEQHAYLVMDLLSGPNLAELVRGEGPVSYAVGIPLLAKVAAGLQAAHDIGIAHRDVKPANIVLDAPPAPDGTRPDLSARPERGRPVLVDFGIARLINQTGQELTGSATAIGTAAYMSPEQATGGEIGTASDIYSLACVSYFLFLGRPPFVGDSSVGVAHAQVYDQPVPLIELSPDAPPALDALLTRMLAKDPAMRPTAREVSDELLAIADDPTIKPGQSGVLPAAPVQLSKTEQKNTEPMQRGGRIAVWLVILALLALTAFAWLRPRDPQPPAPSPTVTMTHTTVVPTPSVSPSTPVHTVTVTSEPSLEQATVTAQQTVTATATATATRTATATATTTTTVPASDGPPAQPTSTANVGGGQ